MEVVHALYHRGMRPFNATVLFLLLAGRIAGQSPEIPVELVVRLSAAARVTILRAGIPVAERFADSAGAFRFDKLQPGTYTIEARANGVVASQRISILAGREEVVITIPSPLVPPKAYGVVTVNELQVPDRVRKEIEEALQLAEQLYRGGRLEESSVVLRDAIRKHGENGDLHGALAHVYFKQGNVGEALKSAVTAADCKSHLPNVHLLLARIYEKQSPEKMIPELELYVREEPPDSPTRKQVLDLLEAH